MRAVDILGSDCLIKDNNNLYGRVEDIIVDLSRPKVAGVVVSTKEPVIEKRFLKIGDIVEFWDKEIFFREENCLKKIDNLVMISSIYNDKLLTINRYGFNSKGKKLGRVVDFDFDLISGWIENFHLVSGFYWWKEYSMINGKYFLEITKRGVIFDIEDGVKVSRKVQEVELAV